MPTTLRIVKPKPTFDVDGFLRSGGAGTTVVAYQPREIVFSQGDASDSVMYLQEGAVKLSVLSRSGQEAVVAMVEVGAFFGESALVGQTLADMVGTTRSRVNFFMNKFKKLGYIEYCGGLKVNDSLLTVILRDERVGVRPSKTG